MTDIELHEHSALKDYERGTQTWVGQVGHWHATEDGRGRAWIKGAVTECPYVAQVRVR